MIRLFVIFGLLLAAALGIAWFADHAGAVTIRWLDYRIDTSFFALAVLTGLLGVAGYILHMLWNWLVRGVPFWGPQRELRRQRQGFSFLNKAVVALAAGDKAKAQKLTSQALRLLPPQAFTHVIAAQVATEAGDKASAEGHFRALMADPDAALLGVKGLFHQAESQGDFREALALAEKAETLAPDSRWVLESLYRLKIRHKDWSGALTRLAKLEKSGNFDKKQASRDRAALYFSQALEADLSGAGDEASSLVAKALKEQPDFVPAVLLAAKFQKAGGDRRKASKIIKTAWQKSPHPDLAAAYSALDAMETPTEQLRRIKALIESAPGHEESLITLSEAALRAEHYEEARDALDRLAAGHPDKRVYALLVRLERAAGGEEAETRAETWGTAEKTAPPPPGWRCGNCGTPHDGWRAICPTCQNFNRIEWGAPYTVAMKRETAALKPSDPLVLLPGPLAVRNDAGGKT